MREGGRNRRRARRGAPATFRAESVLAGRMLVGGRLQPVEIGIGDDGRIVRVARNVQGRRRHDVGELVILPSATDLHVHFRDPGGPSDLESFESGTLQAALGGIGLVGEMPNTSPPVTDADRFDSKARRALGRLAVDVLLYGCAVSPSQVEALASRAGGFKLYMSPTTGIDAPVSGDALRGVLDAVARTGLALSVHAEAPDRFKPPPDGAALDPTDWDRHRPADAEAAAVDRLLPAPAALRLNVAHVTTWATAGRLRAAGEASEVTPHHLLLSARPGQDARFKVHPPLRNEAERTRLWDAFCRGLIPMVASDHAPQLATEKSKPYGEAPSGMPGVETLLPLLLERARVGELALETLVRCASDRPARWLGVPQGRIAVGHRANLVVVDFRKGRAITGRHLHGPCGWSAFEGWKAIFPREHYLDGRAIVKDGEFVGDRSGRLARPDYARSGRGLAPTDADGS